MNHPERPSPGARERFLQAAARQTASRPRAWLLRILLAGVAGLVWLVAVLSILGIRHDWYDLPTATWSLTVGSLLLAALLVSMFGLARGRAMVGAATETLSVTAWGVPLLLLLLVAAVDPRGPSTVVAPDAHMFHAGPCALLVFLVALPFLGIGRLVVRDLVFSRPGLVGACLGLAAATWAHLLIRVHCPLAGIGHAIFGHLLPLLPLLVLGIWTMRRR